MATPFIWAPNMPEDPRQKAWARTIEHIGNVGGQAIQEGEQRREKVVKTSYEILQSQTDPEQYERIIKSPGFQEKIAPLLEKYGIPTEEKDGLIRPIGLPPGVQRARDYGKILNNPQVRQQALEQGFQQQGPVQAQPQQQPQQSQQQLGSVETPPEQTDQTALPLVLSTVKEIQKGMTPGSSVNLKFPSGYSFAQKAPEPPQQPQGGPQGQPGQQSQQVQPQSQVQQEAQLEQAMGPLYPVFKQAIISGDKDTLGQIVEMSKSEQAAMNGVFGPGPQQMAKQHRLEISDVGILSLPPTDPRRQNYLGALKELKSMELSLRAETGLTSEQVMTQHRTFIHYMDQTQNDLQDPMKATQKGAIIDNLFQQYSSYMQSMGPYFQQYPNLGVAAGEKVAGTFVQELSRSSGQTQDSKKYLDYYNTIRSTGAISPSTRAMYDQQLLPKRGSDGKVIETGYRYIPPESAGKYLNWPTGKLITLQEWNGLPPTVQQEVASEMQRALGEAPRLQTPVPQKKVPAWVKKNTPLRVGEEPPAPPEPEMMPQGGSMSPRLKALQQFQGTRVY